MKELDLPKGAEGEIVGEITDFPLYPSGSRVFRVEFRDKKGEPFIVMAYENEVELIEEA